MDVAIKPFWIILSLVYFWLAAIHYKRQFGVIPSTYQAAAYTPAPDNAPDEIRYLYAYIQTAFRQFIRDIQQNKKLMIYASAAFFCSRCSIFITRLNKLRGRIFSQYSFCCASRHHSFSYPLLAKEMGIRAFCWPYPKLPV